MFHLVLIQFKLVSVVVFSNKYFGKGNLTSCLLYTWLQKSCEVVNCPGADCYATEAEGCSEGSLQEQEAHAS